MLCRNINGHVAFVKLLTRETGPFGKSANSTIYPKLLVIWSTCRRHLVHCHVQQFHQSALSLNVSPTSRASWSPTYELDRHLLRKYRIASNSPKRLHTCHDMFHGMVRHRTRGVSNHRKLAFHTLNNPTSGSDCCLLSAVLWVMTCIRHISVQTFML